VITALLLTAPVVAALVCSSLRVTATVLLGLALLSPFGFLVERLVFGSSAERGLLERGLVAVPLGYLLSTGLLVGLVRLLGARPAPVLALLGLGGVLSLGVARWWRRRGPGPRRADRGCATGPNGAALEGLPRTPAALGLLLLLLIALLLPYVRVGALTPRGFVYRDYFSGDYLKHVAVTAELTRGTIPPQNPFIAGGKLHYYWFHYLFPAVLANALGPGEIEPILRALNLLLAGDFLLLWLWTARALVGGRRRWLLTAALPFVGSSLEGTAVLWDLWRQGKSLAGFRDYNVDGFSRWLLGAPEVDGVYRLLLFNMQHIVPVALVLVALLAWRRGSGSRQTALALGLAGALAIGQSGFAGSFFLLWAGACLLLTAEAGGASWRERWIRLGLLAAAPLPAMVWYRWGLELIGEGIPLRLEVAAPLLSRPLRFLLLAFGAGVPGIAGLLAWRRVHRPTALLALLALTVVALVTVPGWGSDVAVKVGYLAALSLALLLGMLLALAARRPAARRALLALTALLLTAGAPTLLLEVWNFADVENPRFTSFVEPWDMGAYEWIRSHTPRDAVVQKGLRSDLRDAPFSPIPTFAHRHTFLGDRMHARIFLVSDSAYEARRAVVQRIFSSSDPREIQQLCLRHGIDYIYWGRQEFEDHGWPRALTSDPQRFRRVFDGERAFLFQVLEDVPG
jgi:hypothetical protein